MKYLSRVVLLFTVPGIDAISLRGQVENIVSGLYETAQRQLMGDMAGGSGGGGGGGMNGGGGDSGGGGSGGGGRDRKSVV